MRISRHHPICGLATNKDGKRHLVVGGGRDGASLRLNDFQSLDMETLEWRMEEKAFLFTDLTYATTVVPYGRSFLVLGGMNNGKDSKDIYWASNNIRTRFLKYLS